MHPDLPIDVEYVQNGRVFNEDAFIDALADLLLAMVERQDRELAEGQRAA